MTLYGNVNGSDASKQSGSTGWTCSKERQGVFLITFSPPFGETPALAVTQNYPNWDGNGSNGNTKDNAVIYQLTANQAKVVTGGSDGSLHDRNFSFIAIGQASL